MAKSPTIRSIPRAVERALRAQCCRRRAVAAILLLAAVATPVATAAAHAVLVAPTPADRSVVPDASAGVSLRFNEAVTPVAVLLIDSQGRAVEAKVTTQDETVHVVPAAPLAADAYIVSWRVISADSHPVAGAFQFAVGSAPPSWQEQSAASVRAPMWTWLAITNGAVHLAAVTLAIGSALFGILGATAPRRLIVWGGAVAIATALLAIGLEGGLVLDRPLADLAGAELWRFGAQTTRGLASGIAILGLLAAIFRYSVIGAGLVIASFALSGHAATAPPRIAAVPALLLHVALAVFWLGAFVPLMRASAEVRDRARRASNWAIPVLLFAGLVLAVIQVRAISPLIDTRYGLALLAKVALVAALVVLILRARWRPLNGKFIAVAALTLGGMILATTAVLTEVPPPRSLVVQAAFSETVPMGAATVTVTVTPGAPGRNAIVARFTGAEGRAFAPRAVEVALSNPAAGIEEISRPMVLQPDGTWRHDGPELTLSGEWMLQFDALIDDFTRSSFMLHVPVR
jgi:copper transport protein